MLELNKTTIKAINIKTGILIINIKPLKIELMPFIIMMYRLTLIKVTILIALSLSLLV